jgi:hypothetical protein
MTEDDVYPRAMSDAVLVRVVRLRDETLASVAWPARHGRFEIDMPPLLNPTTVPVALQRAADVANIYGFSQILVHFEDEQLWRSEWGHVVIT